MHFKNKSKSTWLRPCWSDNWPDKWLQVVPKEHTVPDVAVSAPDVGMMGCVTVWPDSASVPRGSWAISAIRVRTYSCCTAFSRPQTNKIYLLGLRKLQWITQFLSATGGLGFLLEDKEMGKNTKLENFVYISNVFICIINEYYSMYRFYIILDIYFFILLLILCKQH